MSTERFLPLKPDLFHILLSLEGGSKHGYGIVAEVEDRTNGAVRLLPSLLYRRLARLHEEGLVTDTDAGVDESDPRRRYYALTPLGRRVVRAEAERIVALARSLSNRRWAEDG